MYFFIAALILILDAATGSVIASSGVVTPEQLAELRNDLNRFAEEQQRHADFVWVLDCIALVSFCRLVFFLLKRALCGQKILSMLL